MSAVGNILWLVFGGFFTGLGYILGGLIICLSIIGIPFGLKAIQFGASLMTPFGKSTVPREGGQGCLALFFNIAWLVLFGWEIAALHIAFGLVLAVTIVGLPFAQQHFKLVPVALLPFSYKLERLAE
ncbi:YccF domain-containing protein [Phototrophicus methaneseepsis]|uniref:YccF domain-containing protein n=1 Tax=Phototrophicus methaneseepsis TaxID=2710758 RepID=A0A7S8EC01_9CHLR|nr:YccF domain-containing protein [Phototrophicus methaneseepsis]QPC84131.1 YccF domain-containing protein [Phototrophicus methaneseepsis]